MAKVSNETKLVISLLQEKAKARKAISNPDFRNGIDWALDTLAGIAGELERGYKL